ncbi:MAG TPA: hypothetical protein VK934_13230 [Fimbriimonas sp.]|nr:hypothetical protein [Fimbriimonas sp.]
MSFRLKFLLLAALSCLAAVSVAQGDQEYKTVVGKPWKGPQGVRATTKQIMQWQAYQPTQYKFLVMPDEIREEEVQLGPPPAGVQDISQYPPPTAALGGSLITPKPAFSIGIAWDGVGFNDQTAGFVPPDTMGDVGPTNVVVLMNNWIRVYDRAGNMGALNASTDIFFNSVRNAQTVGDSRVRYDRLSQRWIITTFNTANSNNRICIAVSDGPNLTAGTVWTFFFFQHNLVSPAGDTGLFFDYPTLGVDSQALYIGGNCFNGTFTTTAFVVRKSSILGAGPIVVSAFRNLYGSTGIYTPQGVDHDDPASTDGYIIGHGAQYGTLRLRKITTPGGTPVLGPVQNITGMLATIEPTSVPHQGGGKNLDGGDVRMLKAAIHTNALTGVKTLWTTGSVGVNSSGTTSSPTRAATRWYEVQNFSTTPSIRQAGTIFDGSVGPKMYWMGAAAMNRQGHAVIGMSMANASNFASVAYTDRLSSDALGTHRTPIVAAAGVASYNLDSGGSTYRWGDYSNTSVDPTDGMSIWTFQEYTNFANNYEIRVTKLLAPPPATPSTISPSTATQGTSVTFVVSGTSSSGSGFFDPGTGFPNRLASSFSGTGVSVTAVRFTNATSFEVDATIAANATTGARNLTITNPDGQFVTLNNALTIQSGTVALSSVSLPASIGSGATVNGTVTLTGNAANNTVVNLSSNNAALTVPSTVTVLAGQSTAQFSATAGSPPNPVTVTVTAELNAVSKTVDTLVGSSGLALTDLALNRTSVEGGAGLNTRVTVTLSAAAPVGGKVVDLSADSALAPVPATVTVPAGATTAFVTFKANKTGAPVLVTVTGTLDAVSKTDTITVQPPKPVTFAVSPQTVVGGSSTVINATVTLSQTAPTGGVVVSATSGSPNLIMPGTVTVLAGQTSVSFTIGHKTVTSQKIVNANVQTGTTKLSKVITINPPSVSVIDLSAPQMLGGAGASVTGTLTLNAPAPSAGVNVTLTKDVNVITMSPTTVNIPSGATQGTFTITAPNAVSTDATVTITATTGGVGKTKTFKVIAPKLSTAAVDPTTVVGGSGTTVTFTVTLTGPAPTGGMVVSLGSSNSAIASMPASVTVLAGQTTASVTVTHSHPSSQTNVTLSGTLNGVTKNATLTVQ